MAFIITHSSIEEGNEKFGEKLEKLAEPRIYSSEKAGGTDEERKALLGGKGTHFKLYDDDEQCYYTGKFLGDPDSEEAFEPLDWATYYAGCTDIKYRQKSGEYESL